MNSIHHPDLPLVKQHHVQPHRRQRMQETGGIPNQQSGKKLRIIGRYFNLENDKSSFLKHNVGWEILRLSSKVL